ncbi:glycosyltransferase [Parasphingorhabdus sp.]
MFDKIEFYRVDIMLLREMGHEVILAGSPAMIDKTADLYYCWWWGHAPYVLPRAWLRKKPVVVTGAFDYATCREELPGTCYLDRPVWQKLILAGMLRAANANLFISQYEYTEVTSNLKVRRPSLVPLAIDMEKYTPSSNAAKGDYFFAVALSTRENAIRKGLPQTIRAFAQVAKDYPEACLKIAGKTSEYTESLKALARELGVERKVEFLGMVSEEDKIRHYRHCVAYIQPSLYEGFGLAIAEAVASGARIITSNRGAVPEVAGPDGIIVDPNDIEAIAAGMAAVIEAPTDVKEDVLRHNWIKDRYSYNRRRNALEEVINNAAAIKSR